MSNQELLRADDYIRYLEEKEHIKITARTLKFYITQGILPRPEKPKGNVAYYRLDQIPKLKLILSLKSLGKKLKEIKELINKDAPITKESLRVLERETIDRVANKISDIVANLQIGRSAKKAQYLDMLEDIMSKITERDSLKENKSSYYHVAVRLSECLKRSICAVDSDWKRENLQNLFRLCEIPEPFGDYGSVLMKREAKNKLIYNMKKHIDMLQRDLEWLKNLK